MKARPLVLLVLDLWCIVLGGRGRAREGERETGWNGIVGTMHLFGLSRRSQFHF
jgi:hypothetical protein